MNLLYCMHCMDSVSLMVLSPELRTGILKEKKGGNIVLNVEPANQQVTGGGGCYYWTYNDTYNS